MVIVFKETAIIDYFLNIMLLNKIILIESYMIQSRLEHQPVRLKDSQSRIQSTRSFNSTDFEVSRMKCIESIKG